MDTTGPGWAPSGVQVCVRRAPHMHMILDKVSDESAVTLFSLFLLSSGKRDMQPGRAPLRPGG